ncbi:MAG: RNA 2',3'-cyclic phosphodiesterase [Pseudomonadota bacterium]
MKIRSFLAFDINDQMRKELSLLIELMRSKAKGIKWVDPSLMHCTVKFFGDVEEELLMGRLSDMILEEVSPFKPLKFKGVGVGVFPNFRYPKVIWAGLAGDSERAIEMHDKLEALFEEISIKKDKRAFRLHLTIGRMKGSLKGKESLVSFIEKQGIKEFGEVVVDKLTLYKSELTPTGSIYTALNQFPLKGL